MGLIAGLKQVMQDITLMDKSDRNRTAHFCEHRDIRIRFSRARSIWHTLTPSAIRPWWILLEPTRTSVRKNLNTMKNNNNKTEIEVIDNA